MSPKPLFSLFFASLTGLAITCSTSLLGADASEIIGRWNLTVQAAEGAHPSWLEVRKSGHKTLVGSFVGQFGSARPVSEVRFTGKRLRFSIPPQWESRDSHLVFTGQLKNGSLKGKTTDAEGKKISWSGTRAPSLKRTSPAKWGKAIDLFNGKDLSGWKPRAADVPNGWEVKDGLLANTKPGNDLISTRTFSDFKLHAEFRYPQGSNSGIYLRGRYEMQIEDNYGDEPESHKIGGIYGFLTPSLNASKPAGEWQSADVTLIGRVITIVLNGERVIDRQTIPGATGGALDNDEASPGPLMIQGDHGPVEFRNITITPAL